MSQTTTATVTLDYDSRAPRRRGWTWFHAWALPLLLAPGALGSLYWYGDEYGAMAGANLPAIFVVIRMPWVRGLNAPMPIGLIAVFIGLVAMAGIGLLMGRLRVGRWVYLVFPPAFLWTVLTVTGQYRPGREWEPDALCVAWAWGAYGMALVGVGAGVVGLLVRRVRAWRQL